MRCPWCDSKDITSVRKTMPELHDHVECLGCGKLVHRSMLVEGEVKVKHEKEVRNVGAEVVSIIKTELEVRGNGRVDAKPSRVITQYWTLSGNLLWEEDPCSPKTDPFLDPQHVIEELSRMIKKKQGVIDKTKEGIKELRDADGIHEGMYNRLGAILEHIVREGVEDNGK